MISPLTPIIPAHTLFSQCIQILKPNLLQARLTKIYFFIFVNLSPELKIFFVTQMRRLKCLERWLDISPTVYHSVVTL
jgi:hypothetical protein